MPVIGPMAVRAAQATPLSRFPGSGSYWESRYLEGGDSGAGSYGEWARYKAGVLNAFVAEHAVIRVIEWGCGDGHQLTLASYPQYIGLDVSGAAIDRCIEAFVGDETKSFFAYDPDRFQDHASLFRAPLALSLDVIYHLVEDQVYELYMRNLFDSAEQFVIVYSSNEDLPQKAQHVRHRRFASWVEENRPEWRLREMLRNELGGVVDFYVFERSADLPV